LKIKNQDRLIFFWVELFYSRKLPSHNPLNPVTFAPLLYSFNFTTANNWQRFKDLWVSNLFLARDHAKKWAKRAGVTVTLFFK